MSSVTRGYVGDGPIAVEHAEQGLRLSPLDAFLFLHEGALAQAHYVNGDHEAAIAWARRAAVRNHSAIFNYRLLAASYAALGNELEARRAVREILRLQPSFRLAGYMTRCPFSGPALDNWIARLRSAGLPD
jgi:adenylate cyclase